MVGILSMKTESDAKASIFTFLQRFIVVHIKETRCLHPHILYRHFTGTFAQKEERQKKPSVANLPVMPQQPFCSRPQATYLIDIANTSALNCLFKHLNEKPFPARMGSYPRELCAACFPPHSLRAQKPKCHSGFIPLATSSPHSVCVCVWEWSSGVGLKYFETFKRHLG